MLLPHELHPPHEDIGALQAVQEPQLDTGALHVLQLETGALHVWQLGAGAQYVLHVLQDEAQ